MLLGIDIGTSACKAAVFDLQGNCLRSETVGYKVYYPQEGYAEQDPAQWYNAVCEGLQKIFAFFPKNDIKAVGIDGQSWSCIPVDKDGAVLHNTPIWFDMRADQECALLKERIGEPEIFRVCKNPVVPSYSTPKILWFKRHKPDVYKNAHKFLQSNSYIIYRLTGVFSQDKSQGYGHFFYDMDKSAYNANMAERMGIDIGKLPDIYDCSQVVGTVSRQAAAETGLPVGVPVVAGGLDAACGTLGAGVYAKGQTQEQGGQAGGMSICVDEALGDERLILSNHVVPGMWLLQGGTVAGGAAMQWFYEQFGDGAGFDELNRLAEAVPAASDGLVFLPYLNGERSPIWDSNAKGVYYGLTFSKTKGHFVRATMEGTAYALRHNLEVAEKAGAGVALLHAVGGACNSRLWMQIKADVTKTPIRTVQSDNATALGAAMLAGVGVGAYRDFDEAVKFAVRFKDSYTHDEANYTAYDRAYAKYRAIYEQLKEVMKQ